MIPEIPEVEVHKNFPDNVRFLDKGDDLHGSLTLRALQRVHMIHLLISRAQLFRIARDVKTGSINAETESSAPAFFLMLRDLFE